MTKDGALQHQAVFGDLVLASLSTASERYGPHFFPCVSSFFTSFIACVCVCVKRHECLSETVNFNRQQ